jgi:hypothetical protein
VERIIFAIETNDRKPFLHINIKCQDYQDQISEDDWRRLEEEFRSAILRLTMLDAQIPKIPQGEYFSLLDVLLNWFLIFSSNLYRLQLEDYGCNKTVHI